MRRPSSGVHGAHNLLSSPGRRRSGESSRTRRSDSKTAVTCRPQHCEGEHPLRTSIRCPEQQLRPLAATRRRSPSRKRLETLRSPALPASLRPPDPHVPAAGASRAYRRIRRDRPPSGHDAAQWRGAVLDPDRDRRAEGDAAAHAPFEPRLVLPRSLMRPPRPYRAAGGQLRATNAGSIRSPAGIPSRMASGGGPWDSPAVERRSAMGKFSFPMTPARRTVRTGRACLCARATSLHLGELLALLGSGTGAISARIARRGTHPRP